MSWFESVRSGFEAIISHGLRSVLTVLGILIGVAAVILTVGLGEGAQQSVGSAISSLGTNLLIVTPGSSSANGVSGGLGSATTLTMGDANALSSKWVAPDVAAVAPSIQRNETLASSSNNWTAPVVGSTPSFMGVRDRSMAQGSFISQTDLNKGLNVAVLGPTVASSLFPSGSAVGKSVSIGALEFQVIGVLNTAGSSSAAANEDDQVIVPITAAQAELIGRAKGNSLETIYVEATSKSTLGAAYQEVNSTLLSLHHITNPNQPDFTILAQSSLLSVASSITQTLTILLASVAAISLLVGGIGVMNIMLVSVTERVKEIGLRKALGARPSIIRRQFLIEAVMLALFGGVGGIALGLAGVIILRKSISSISVAISDPAIAGAVFVSVAIGVIFGVYPATRAAAMAPIDALRSE